MKEIKEVKRGLVEILERPIDVQVASDDEGVFTSKEAAAYLGIGLNSFYELCNRKDFPSFKVGTKIIVPKRKLKDWIEKQTKKERSK
ncbi:helix-turn-helix domain-containing protein [Alkaliphilus oremlandii]|nr:helix-turn-helix domain-containing protein [Alkaliphilus oremlandii]